MAKSREDRPLSSLERLILQTMGDGKTFGKPGDPAADSHPNVWEWMTRCDAPKDRILTPSFLRVTAVNDGFLAVLTCPDLASQVECPVPHLLTVWECLEKYLTSPDLVIKVWGKKEPDMKKKKKKD